MLRPPPCATLFPYTTLFRSRVVRDELGPEPTGLGLAGRRQRRRRHDEEHASIAHRGHAARRDGGPAGGVTPERLRERVDRKSTRLNSSHMSISYAVFCLKKK